VEVLEQRAWPASVRQPRALAPPLRVDEPIHDSFDLLALGPADHDRVQTFQDKYRVDNRIGRIAPRPSWRDSRL
jgi:hypothetical protein